MSRTMQSSLHERARTRLFVCLRALLPHIRVSATSNQQQPSVGRILFQKSLEDGHIALTAVAKRLVALSSVGEALKILQFIFPYGPVWLATKFLHCDIPHIIEL